MDSAGSASEFVTVSSGFDEAVSVVCVSGVCTDASTGTGTGFDSGLGSTAGAEAVEAFETDAVCVGVDESAAAGAGAVVEVVGLGGASTLRLTCFSLTIVMRLDPKSADPSIFAKRVLMYSTSRSKL